MHKTKKMFFKIYALKQCTNCTVVIAQSSSFGLFYVLKAIESSDWVECLYKAKFISLKPFNDDMAKTFLISLLGTDADESDVDSMVQYCKGIPKLLCVCTTGVARYKTIINSVRLHEFRTVMNFMRDCYRSVCWKSELNLLVAARFKLNISHVGLTRLSAENLIMCLSYLVGINEEDVPIIYFPRDSHEGLFLEALVKSMWENMNTLFPKTDSQNVIGEYFECQLPFIICPKLNVQVKKLRGSNGTVTNIELDLNTIVR